jgi:hypothetical protein
MTTFLAMTILKKRRSKPYHPWLYIDEALLMHEQKPDDIEFKIESIQHVFFTENLM